MFHSPTHKYTDMLKHFLKTALLGLFSVVGLASCDSAAKQAEDFDALRPTLLGGVYFYRGYGGVDAVASLLSSEGVSQIEGYKELFIDPYKNEDPSNITSNLERDWGITDAAGLKAKMESLKTAASEHKAWDFARGVMIAWSGLKIGFLTREEVDTYIKSLVPLAQAKFADWNAYYKDFIDGRAAWDPQNEYGGKDEFEAAVKDLLENPQSIYKVIPLK